MNEQNAKLSILTLLEKKFNILLEITNSRNHQKSILDLSHNVLSGLNSVLRKKVEIITIQKLLILIQNVLYFEKNIRFFTCSNSAR